MAYWHRVRGKLGQTLAAALGLLAAALLLGSCQPREISPTQPSLLVQPERELLQYRRLVLPNGLKVMLVSDPRTESSAAAMAVGAGSLNDPKDRPGLAHFTEHMLFLGTKKYPEANAYTQYLSSHAGSSNAYTADDQTNFFFHVANEGFEGALDRFSQFFIAPLFTQAYTDREMHAVDSEHSKNVENDYWRTRAVEQLAFDPNHPISHFSTGDLDTLSGVTHEELLAFYRSHYSANLMTLAVVSNRSLDELEKMVRARFDQVPDRHLKRSHFPEQFLAPKPALRLLQVEPVADERSLSLMFPLPPVVKLYDARPLQLIGFVLGHEGQGSLLSLLKAEGLAQSLSAGESEDTHDYSSFEINIGLTPLGLKRYQDVIRYTLGAIDGLRKDGIPRYVFDENQIMSRLDYRYREVPSAGSMARRLSAMMQDYPLDVLPEAPFLIKRYAPKEYARFLDRMRPDNMLVTLVAKGVRTDNMERYYKARFSYDVLTGAPYQQLVALAPDSRWHLPARNPFIPHDVQLYEPEGPLKLARLSLYRMRDDHVPDAVLKRLLPDMGQTYTSAKAFLAHMQTRLEPDQRQRWVPTLLEDALPLPVRLLDTPQAKVWYEPDWRFRQPKAGIRLKFFVDGAYGTPQQAMLGSLYESVIEEGLNEYGYPIKEAGLGYSIDAVRGGIVLSLSGYSARMLDLLKFLMPRLQRVNVDERTFESLKEQARRDLVNASLDQPYRQSQYYARLLLEQPNYTREALLSALEPLTLRDVRDYAARVLKRTYVEGVVVGNLPRDVARMTIEGAIAGLHAQPLAPNERVEPVVRQMPQRANWVFSHQLAINNSLVQLLYQVGPREPDLEAALEVIGRPLSESFYHDMRTQQQLGYIVWAGASDMQRTLNLFFLVQSGQYGPGDLEKRMNAFIPGFIQTFHQMPDASFEQYRNAVIQSKLTRAKNLGEVADGLYWSAFRNDARFDYVSDELAALNTLTRAEVETVLKQALTGDRERKLAIRLIAKDKNGGTPRGQVVELPAAVRAKAG
ncbi:MAG TPA: insulinase family protein [bacterium]|nr:insulinase family protein [bacterium]